MWPKGLFAPVTVPGGGTAAAAHDMRSSASLAQLRQLPRASDLDRRYKLAGENLHARPTRERAEK